MAGKTVCVTGGAGYVASWIIKFLLQRGYTVKASVRNPDDPKKKNHLLALEGAKERLHLLKADLLEEGSFDSLVQGCDGVFHCACPVFFDCKDPQSDPAGGIRVDASTICADGLIAFSLFGQFARMAEYIRSNEGILDPSARAELLDPALKGTLNVLGSVSRTPSVKRVIMTSSESVVAFNGTPLTPEVEIDETWWSDPDYLKKNQMWYLLSKTIAEKAAWEFVKEKGIDMVTINPTCIIGPLLQPTLNTTPTYILSLINGSETFPNATFGWIDVRDVANAHVLAFEKPEANGRYLMVERGVNFSEIVKILRGHYPHLKLPEKPLDGKPLTLSYRASRKRTEGLGIVYTPIEQSVKDTAESLKEKGLFKGHL